jgi:hypothetical protein
MRQDEVKVEATGRCGRAASFHSPEQRQQEQMGGKEQEMEGSGWSREIGDQESQCSLVAQMLSSLAVSTGPLTTGNHGVVSGLLSVAASTVVSSDAACLHYPML